MFNNPDNDPIPDESSGSHEISVDQNAIDNKEKEPLSKARTLVDSSDFPISEQNDAYLAEQRRKLGLGEELHDPIDRLHEQRDTGNRDFRGINVEF